MATAQDGDTVKVHYTGTLSDGTQFDSSAGRDPLEFTLGAGNVIAGFDDAARGMSVGEKKTVTIPAAQAYGEQRPELVQEIERSMLPEDLDVEIGTRLRTGGDEPMIVVVTALSDSSVTLDGNHDLAGQDLTFAIELVGIG